MFFFLKGQLMYDLPHDHHRPSPVASKGTQIRASLGGGQFPHLYSTDKIILPGHNVLED